MQMDERATDTPILGIFRGGVVRLLDAVQWQEGSRVEVRVVDTGQDVPPSKVGLVIREGFRFEAVRRIAQQRLEAMESFMASFRRHLRAKTST